VRIDVLTTETPHHAYFVRRLAQAGVLGQVWLEQSAARAPFPIAHPFEEERDAYELAALLDGDERPIEGRAVETVNDPEVAGALSGDLVVAFGTGLIRPRLIAAVAPGRLLNLHGGNPEEYRGLDTHLWAIYHRDFANLITTLHHVDPGLDTGAIVGQAQIVLRPGAALHELRARNTELCVALVLAAARTLETVGELLSRPQVRRGRYYSFMPAVLKEVCVARFAEHVAAAP
jgi:methionyl-tRNA formyltransferase